MKISELKRKLNIYIWTFVITVVLIISVGFLVIYTKQDDSYYVKFNDSGEIDYTVSLKANNYFEQKDLEKNRQYISSLIEKINAKFKYEMVVNDSLEYKYNYKITANVNVIDNETNKIIYNTSEDLIQEISGENKKLLKIEEDVEIDYNKYNNLIKKFVTGYKLKGVTSKLTISMRTGIAGLADSFKHEEAVLNLDIPLTTDTVSMDESYNLASNSSSLITVKEDDNKVILYWSIVLLVVDMVLTTGLTRYVKKNSTQEEKYKSELNKILNNYGTYISEIEDEFDMKGYQILKVKSFIDLLEIRDTMHLPIIMLENKESLSACFIIPTSDKILYFYSLGITQYSLPGSTNKNTEETE